MYTKDNIRIRRNVRVLKQLTITPYIAMAVFIDFESDSLPDDRDFIFKPKYPGIYIHLINANFRVIHMRNDTDRSFKINRKNRLGKLIEIEEE